MSRDRDEWNRLSKPTWRPKPESQNPGTLVAVYYCPFCPFVTGTGPALLSYHLRSHLGTQHCPACGVSAASKPALHQHIARRHIYPDKVHHGDEAYLVEASDACLVFCEACRLMEHYDRRVLGHCCFLCDYSDSNPLDLYRHVMIGHVQIAKSRETNIVGSREMDIAKSRETNKLELRQQASKLSTAGIDDSVSQVEDGGQKCCSVHLKSEEDGKRLQGDNQHTLEPQRCGKRKSPPVSPLTVEHTHASSPAFSIKKECVDVTVPPKKRRKIFRDSGNNENCLVRADAFSETTTTSQKDTKESEGLLPASERRIPAQNTEAVMSRATYNVGFRSVWVPIISPSPPVLEQEVPLDLSLRKAQAPPTDKTESTMPVITSVFSWKDYI